MQDIEQSRLRNLENVIRKNGIKIRLLLVVLVLILLYCSAIVGYVYGVASQVRNANSSYIDEIEREINAAQKNLQKYQAEVDEYEANIAALDADIKVLSSDN